MYGDTLVGAITVLVCVHTSTAPVAKKIELLTPPQVAPAPSAAYLWVPFEKISSMCLFVRANMAFESVIVDGDRMTSESEVNFSWL